MFDIGFAELVFLAVLGLVFLGPKRLPKVAAQLGRWVGQARRMSRTLMYQLQQEVKLDDPQPFSTRRPAEASKRPNPNTAHKEADSGKKETGSDNKETDSDKKETQASKSKSSGRDEAAQSQSSE